MKQSKNKIKLVSTRWKVSAYIIMLTFTVLTVFPLIWLFYTSLKSNVEILNFPLALPKKIEIKNYVQAWKIGGMGVAILNSIFYSTTATVCTLILSMAAAFGITKFSYKSNSFIYGAFTAGILITVHAIILPLFILESKIGLINTRIGVILPYIAFDLPISIIIACSYVGGLPNALIEAAFIDGASYFQVFFRIVLPCSTPVMATMAILSFLRHWNEFIFVFVLTTGNDKRSIPVALTNFASRFNVDYATQFAALVISIIPMITFYILFHNKIIKGFGEGALKE